MVKSLVLDYSITVENLVYKCEKLNIPPFFQPPPNLYPSFSQSHYPQSGTSMRLNLSH